MYIDDRKMDLKKCDGIWGQDFKDAVEDSVFICFFLFSNDVIIFEMVCAETIKSELDSEGARNLQRLRYVINFLTGFFLRKDLGRSQRFLPVSEMDFCSIEFW